MKLNNWIFIAILFIIAISFFSIGHNEAYERGINYGIEMSGNKTYILGYEACLENEGLCDCDNRWKNDS